MSSSTSLTSKQSSKDPWECKDCTKTFPTRLNLKIHRQEIHSKTCLIRFKDSTGLQKTVNLIRVEGFFECPCCGKGLGTKSGILKHVGATPCNTDSDDENVDSKENADDDDDNDDVNDENDQEDIVDDNHDDEDDECSEVTLESAATCTPLSLPLLSSVEKSPPPTRTHDETMLDAFNLLYATDHVKTMLLLLMETLKMSPIIINEQSSVTHHSRIKRACDSQSIVTVVVPDPKRTKLDSSHCENCLPTPAVGLENLMATSPYSSVLRTRQFIELTPQHSELLNEEWTFKKQVPYACARLLAGCILLNTSNGEAVMVNTVEVCGRNKQLDIHRERLLVKKGEAVKTSLPPSTGSRYDDVWPLTLSAADGERLVIGTRSFNALITSSLRLDTECPPSLGGTTMSFRLSTNQASKATRIFLDKKSITDAIILWSDVNCRSVLSKNIVGELRQLRSKFHDPSTFLLYRASGQMTRHVSCQPYTVFNVVTCDRSDKGKVVATAALFHEIAKEIQENGEHARLSRSTVEKGGIQCNSQPGSIGKTMESVYSLFTDGENSIPIIGNKELNKGLQELASQLSPLIVKANQNASVFVKLCFNPQ